jgi:hypothetical protein
MGKSIERLTVFSNDKDASRRAARDEEVRLESQPRSCASLRHSAQVGPSPARAGCHSINLPHWTHAIRVAMTSIRQTLQKIHFILVSA